MTNFHRILSKKLVFKIIIMESFREVNIGRLINKSIDLYKKSQIVTSPHVKNIWAYFSILLTILAIIYFYNLRSNINDIEIKFALASVKIPLRIQKFPCAANYEKEIQQFPMCVPKQCGRFVSDDLVDVKEADVLLDLAENVISLGGSSGGVSILDLHSGALSYGDKFINIYNHPKLLKRIKSQYLNIYNTVKEKIKLAIAEYFNIDATNLYLTYPTFFSRITNSKAKTLHDEYWHEHVDKETYPSFHYTSLLYLTSSQKDFQGGSFIFIDGVDKNRTTSSIQPKKGRVSAFTSGSDNRHHVEKVSNGIRYAVTISFTCDPRFSIGDPKILLTQNNNI